MRHRFRLRWKGCREQIRGGGHESEARDGEGSYSEAARTCASGLHDCHPVYGLEPRIGTGSCRIALIAEFRIGLGLSRQVPHTGTGVTQGFLTAANHEAGLQLHPILQSKFLVGKLTEVRKPSDFHDRFQK